MKITKLCIRFKNLFYTDDIDSDSDNDNDYYSDNSDNRFVEYDKLDYDNHFYHDDDEIEIDISDDEEI